MNNGPQNTTEKTKDWAIQTSAAEGQAVSYWFNLVDDGDNEMNLDVLSMAIYKY